MCKESLIGVEEYNDEPVFYCSSCHSLRILVDDRLADESWDGSYCAECGCTDISSCSIEEWLEKDAEIHRFIEK